MAGWLIKIATLRMGGGRDLCDLWAVGAADQGAALALLERTAIIHPDQTPKLIEELSEERLRSFDVADGEAKLVVTQS